MLSKMVRNFIGTAILIWAGCEMAVLTGPTMLDLPFVPRLLCVAEAFGVALTLLARLGGDYNPAVTLYKMGQYSHPEVLGIVFAEYAGAIVGAWCLFPIGNAKAAGFGASYPRDGVPAIVVTLVEAAGMFLLLYVVRRTSDEDRPVSKQVAALSVGQALAVAVFIVGLLVGSGAINLFRAWAPMLRNGDMTAHGDFLWATIIAVIVGWGFDLRRSSKQQSARNA